MNTKKSIAINLATGAWTATLIVLTTPWFISHLGLEGYGLIGLWMVIIYMTLILDLGLGSTCAREMAMAVGRRAERREFRELLVLFERPVLLIGVAVLAFMWLVAPWLSGTWLNAKGYSHAELATTFHWMSISIAAQVVITFYGLALGGLQRQRSMNGLQALNNGLRYLGGSSVVALGGSIIEFFVFQAAVATMMIVLSRMVLLHPYAKPATATKDHRRPALRDHVRFSGGMFATAMLAAAVANADRFFVSKLLPVETLGRYTVAATVIGLLQMFIVSLHRVYQPKFAELTASGNVPATRRAYYQACMTVGATIIPLTVVFVLYANDVFLLWVGWTDAETTLVARLLVIGYAMAGLMWLPASYQQALGWTKLNVSLMAVSCLLGMPLLWLSIRAYGLAGAAAMMLVHGTVQLVAGLLLMNRVCFPGENWLWIRRVVVAPLCLSLPISVIIRWLVPAESSLPARAAWMGFTAVLIGLLTYWGRDRIASVETASSGRNPVDTSIR